MRDKTPKLNKRQQIEQRQASCLVRIQYLSTLPDSELNQLIEKSRGLF